MTESYADYPTLLGDVRSDRSNKAEDWSVREMLIDLLKRIDGGEKFDAAVVCYRSDQKKDEPYTTFICAGGKPIELWGIVARAQHLLHMQRPL